MRYLFLLLPFLIYAKSYQISSIPLPKTYVINMDIYPCNEKCMIDYYTNGYIFSFLAQADMEVENSKLNEKILIYKSLFNIGTLSSTESVVKVALLLPYKVIGRYAALTTNSVFAYMLAKNSNFEIESYEVEDESVENIEKTLQQIKDDGFEYVIAPLTKNGVLSVIEIAPELKIFFPTINKKVVATNSADLYFGGIDYDAQIDKLLEYSTSPLVIFYDNSELATALTSHAKESYLFVNKDKNSSDYVLSRSPNNIFTFQINKHSSNLKKELQNNQKIEYGTFVLNTPIVKSSLVMSQITLYDVNTTNILSTQINYDPIILSMTQNSDRKHMIIANSIGMNNQVIIEANTLLENDIIYDWINYATTVGIDYFNNLITGSQREYSLEIGDNQVIYPINLVKPTFSRFVDYYE